MSKDNQWRQQSEMHFASYSVRAACTETVQCSVQLHKNLGGQEGTLGLPDLFANVSSN